MLDDLGGKAAAGGGGGGGGAEENGFEHWRNYTLPEVQAICAQ
jgi:hypothetical protein